MRRVAGVVNSPEPEAGGRISEAPLDSAPWNDSTRSVEPYVRYPRRSTLVDQPTSSCANYHPKYSLPHPFDATAHALDPPVRFGGATSAPPSNTAFHDVNLALGIMESLLLARISDLGVGMKRSELHSSQGVSQVNSDGMFQIPSA